MGRSHAFGPMLARSRTNRTTARMGARGPRSIPGGGREQHARRPPLPLELRARIQRPREIVRDHGYAHLALLYPRHLVRE